MVFPKLILVICIMTNALIIIIQHTKLAVLLAAMRFLYISYFQVCWHTIKTHGPLFYVGPPIMACLTRLPIICRFYVTHCHFDQQTQNYIRCNIKKSKQFIC